MDEFEQPIDKIIRQAREQGDFDNLPGKGKPIRWEEDSLVPDDQRLANQILKNNDFTLDWIELVKGLDGEFEKARHALEHARSERNKGRLSDAAWQDFVSQHIEKVRDLNRRLIGYNMRVPHAQFQRNPYPIDQDVKDALD